jgi:hypothetical protein
MRPQKDTSLSGNASFEPSTMEIGLPVWPVEMSKKIIWKEGDKRKAMHKKSQKCYSSRSCGGGTPGAISMKFGSLVHIVIVINFAKLDHCNINGLNLARVYIYHFPMFNLAARTTGLALTCCPWWKMEFKTVPTWMVNLFIPIDYCAIEFRFYCKGSQFEYRQFLGFSLFERSDKLIVSVFNMA